MNPAIAALAEQWRDAQPYADGGWATFSYIEDGMYRCKPLYVRDLEEWVRDRWDAWNHLKRDHGWRWDDDWNRVAA